MVSVPDLEVFQSIVDSGAADLKLFRELRRIALEKQQHPFEIGPQQRLLVKAEAGRGYFLDPVRE
jgi:hypothetical protein